MSEIRKITLQFPSLRAFLAEYGEGISEDGMLLRSESPPAAGTTVEVEVVVAEGMRLLRARGEVVWSEAGGGDGLKSAAVRFGELDEASRTLVSKIADQRRRAGAEPFSLDKAPGPRPSRARDLTVPATSAAAAASDPAADSVFDLGEPPPAPTEDLLGPAPAAAAEPQAATRRPRPPVPLFADESGPLAAEPPAGDDAGAEEKLPAGGAAEAGSGSDLGQPAADGGGPAPTGPPDLSDLFDGDEPQTEPARGRTEAFPPSFLDEVKAELEAADPKSGAAAARQERPPPKPAAAPSERSAGAPSKAAASPPAAVPEPPAEPEVEVAPAEPEPPPVEAEREDSPQVTAAEAATPEAAEPRLEPETAPVAPSPPAERPAPPPIEEPPPAPAPRPPASPAGRELAEAGRGPETVEIPLPSDRSPAGPAPAAGSPAAAEKTPPLAATPPAAATPPPAPGMEDNLLTIPELSGDRAAEPPPAARPAPEELPNSAQSLRGAASSSRRLGTWILIALLLAALGVAGYLLWGMVGADGEPVAQPPVTAAPEPLSVGSEVPAGGSLADGAAETGTTDPAAAEPEVEPATDEPETGSADAEPAAAAPAEPSAPLTGLERITWSETAGDTVLALVGDGEISRQEVELVPIGGEQPRLVIKISGIQRPFQPAVLEVGTAQVRRIRTGLHASGELHVVVDLAAAGIAVEEVSERGSRLEVRLGRE